MDDDNIKYQQEVETQAGQESGDEGKRSIPAGKRRAVWVAALLSVLAWVLLGFVPEGAVAAAAVSLVFAVYGIVRTSGSVRTWAVTVTIASGVLLVVFAVFWVVLNSLL